MNRTITACLALALLTGCSSGGVNQKISIKYDKFL